MLRSTIIFLLVLSAVMGRPIAEASISDLAITASNIRFSTSEFYAGDTVRIYAKVRNLGDVDMAGYVLFYQGSMPIDRSREVSMPANGSPDEVYVDFVVPTGTFNIRAVLQGTSPQDVNPENDVAITPLYTPIVDADRDGVADDADNCSDVANADQADTDADTIGDACDGDDDNDGVADGEDPAPTDPSVTEVEEEDPAPAPVVAPPVSAPILAPAVAHAEPVSVPVQNVAVANDAASTAGDQPVPTPLAAVMGSSKLSISPHARFTYRQVDWRTYEFAIADQPEDGVQFSWDFGDGASSVQPTITHAFAGSGNYTVTLATVADDGTTASDAQTLEISFFHLNNPLLDVLIGILIALLVALAAVAYKLKRAYDQKVAE